MFFFFILLQKINKKQQRHAVITAKLPSNDVPRSIQCQLYPRGLKPCVLHDYFFSTFLLPDASTAQLSLPSDFFTLLRQCKGRRLDKLSPPP